MTTTFAWGGFPVVAFYATMMMGFVVLVIVGKTGAQELDKKIYINWHLNVGVGGPYEVVFYPTNDIDEDVMSVSPDFNEKPGNKTQDQEFLSGLNALKDIVEKAAKDGKRLRPYGSRWSFTDLPYTDEYMIDTYGLNYAKIGIESDSYVTSDYQGEQKELLTFVQGGVLIKYLYEALFAEGLTLSTSPTTDGQTMAGAISTGSHNAAISYGAMQEMVRGIHLVLLGQTVFLQKESDPVVTDAYMEAIGADDLISDDDLFHAALVSFGTFGVVHGYLIETEKLFRLKMQIKQFPFSEASDALYSLDVESLGFEIENPEELPWHLQAYINPFLREAKFGCTVVVMEKVSLSDDELNEIKVVGASYEPTYYGTDLMLVMAEVANERLLEFAQAFGNGFIVAPIKRLYYGVQSQAGIIGNLQFAGLQDQEGYPLELFGAFNSQSYYTTSPLSSTSMEVCVSLTDLEMALPFILDVFFKYPCSVAVNTRFLKPSNATLAPSIFEDISVCMGFNSADNPETRFSYQMVQKALETRRDDFSFTYHFGKVIPRNDVWVEKSYGAAELGEWKAQRNRLLTARQMRYVFSNEYTDTIGLTS